MTLDRRYAIALAVCAAVSLTGFAVLRLLDSIQPTIGGPDDRT